ncbi:hypothetical protein D3C72_1066620 [compost metagenome]
MTLVRWNDEGQPHRVIGLSALLGIGFCLFYFFGGYRLIASIWARGEADLAWWPLFGTGSLLALAFALLGPCCLLPLLKRFEVSAGLSRGILLSGAIACLLGVGLDSGRRVELRGDEVWLRGHSGAVRAYQPSAFASFQVSCLNGRRGSPEPGLRLETKDGQVFDLADMFAIGWNGPDKGVWLDAVEDVAQAARREGIVQASRHPEQGWLHFDRGCVTRFAERFPIEDRARVAGFFTFPI